MKSDSEDRSISAQLFQMCSGSMYRNLYAYYEQQTIFDILGVSRSENRHSDYLAWLFSSEPSHGLATFGVERLLHTMVKIKTTLQSGNSQLHWEYNEEFERAILRGDFSASDVHVYREVFLNKGSRIDLKIECMVHWNNAFSNEPLSIFIENKVSSKESDNQTVKYYQNLQNYPNKKLFVFLSPVPREIFESSVQPLCSCKSFIGLNYQYLLEGVLEPCALACNDTHSRFLMSDYIRTIGKPPLPPKGISEKTTNQKGELIMAISENERELLNDFWNANESILLAIIDARSADPDVPEDQKAALQEVLALNKREREKDKKINYTIFGRQTQGALGVHFLKDVVTRILTTYPDYLDAAVSQLTFLKTGPEPPENLSIFRKYTECEVAGNQLFIATSTGNPVKVTHANTLVSLICQLEPTSNSLEILSDVTLV